LAMFRSPHRCQLSCREAMIRFTLLPCEIAKSPETAGFGACVLGCRFPGKFLCIVISHDREI
jgi:hypothetical protein